uniref:Argininosuccinate synthase n=1 Tax=Lygus hesperus TaxID=30085 RepID=A0A0A9W8W8_LYGHE
MQNVMTSVAQILVCCTHHSDTISQDSIDKTVWQLVPLLTVVLHTLFQVLFLVAVVETSYTRFTQILKDVTSIPSLCRDVGASEYRVVSTSMQLVYDALMGMYCGPQSPVDAVPSGDAEPVGAVGSSSTADETAVIATPSSPSRCEANYTHLLEQLHSLHFVGDKVVGSTDGMEMKEMQETNSFVSGLLHRMWGS